MKTLNLQQGSADWHAHRSMHFNASDAPAALGCSKYQNRTELLQAIYSGISPEVDSATQDRFDDGHRCEALARPVAEEIIDDDLPPLVGSVELDGLSRGLSASFDGLTFMRDTIWEHKLANEALRAALPSEGRDSHQYNDAALLPKAYRVQMEQQLMISGGTRCLFSATRWNRSDEIDEERHAWYYPDLALRAEIVAGWRQFDADLAIHSVKPAAPVVVAEPVQALPAVVVHVTGEIKIHENFDAFETAARDFLSHRLIREPKTDQDFADLDLQIKAMKGAEAALDAAENGWIAQIDAVADAKRRKDVLAKLMRDNRLMAEKLLASEKERRRGEIVAGGVKALAVHIAALNARIGKPYMPAAQADFGGVIKGKKNLDSMQDAVDAELARAKIAANATADRIDCNLKHLAAAEYASLFPDTAAIVLKAPDDLAALIASRIAAHKAAEAAKEAVAPPPPPAPAPAPTFTRAAPAVRAAAVVEHQDDISRFLATRRWEKGQEQFSRAVLVEYEKFKADQLQAA